MALPRYAGAGAMIARSALVLLAPALALAPAGGGTALAQPAAPAGPPPGMAMHDPFGRDPFGDATVARKDAEAQAAARFAQADTNGDGVLSADELRVAWPGNAGRDRPHDDRSGPGRASRGGMARLFDTDGDGRITRDEFVAGSLRRFDRMDADHDGQLTKAERDAAMAAMRARMEERMGAMMSGGMAAEGPMGGGDD